MKTLAFFLSLCLSTLIVPAQVVTVTFNATGEASGIDWIQATNLNSNVSVTLPGSAKLNLIYVGPHSPESGVSDIETVSIEAAVYPNPSQGTAQVAFRVDRQQYARLTVCNMGGQVVAQTECEVDAGQNEFRVNFPDAGTYYITVTTPTGTTVVKAISTGSGGPGGTLVHSGSGSADGRLFIQTGLKGSSGNYELNMTEGDVILFRCSSGTLTTLIADSPKRSRDYEVRFVECQDPSGRNYPTVTINGQTWMAENLAWLPAVSPPTEGYIDQPAYYVYGNRESNPALARASENYQAYGALYNWSAARKACPTGWKLPSDADFIYLERSLGMIKDEVKLNSWRTSGMVGCKMKETGTEHWVSGNNSPGNLSGFSALPGGYVAIATGNPHKSANAGNESHRINFAKLGFCSHFWTSTAVDKNWAVSRRLGCLEDGVERNPGIKSFGYSVRCVKDEAVPDVVKDN
jgi:uncharacterized protein (TIGR02145 family)